MKKIKLLLYILGILALVIPILVTVFSSYRFSMVNIRILSGIIFAFVAAGNILSVIEKKKQDKEIWLNLGLVVGLAVIFVLIVLL